MKILVPEVLETERLRLRQFVQDDWPALHAYYSNTDAIEFTVGRAFSEGETWRSMCAMLGHWQIHGYGPYALEVKESKQVIGVVGFWYPNDWPSPEIKWALAPAFWGRGYASEAARVVQSAGLQYLPEIALISFIHAENKPSLRLAEAIGATFEHEILFRAARWHIYRHPQQK